MITIINDDDNNDDDDNDDDDDNNNNKTMKKKKKNNNNKTKKRKKKKKKKKKKNKKKRKKEKNLRKEMVYLTMHSTHLYLRLIPDDRTSARPFIPLSIQINSQTKQPRMVGIFFLPLWDSFPKSHIRRLFDDLRGNSD